MAKTESTAVNQLIELMQTATPLKPDPSEDLMFRAPEKQARMTSTIPVMRTTVPPLPRMRAPQGTQAQGVPAIPAKPPVRMSTATHPITMPEVQPWAQAEGTGETDVITDVRNESVAPKQTARPSLPPPIRPSGPPPMPARASVVAAAVEAPTAPAAFAAPAAPSYPSAAPYLAQVSAADMTSHQPWFDAEQPASAPIEVDVELGTDRVRAKATDWKALLPKLIAPTLGLCIVGMFVGGFLAFNGQGKPRQNDEKKTEKTETKVALKATPAPVATPEVQAPTTPPNLAPHATAPAADVPAAPRAPSSLVDVRLDSTPPGATVTLIDRGKSTFLGSTPISTALDPSRKYDVVFSHASKPTQVEHLDPSVTKRLAIVLGKASKAEVAKPELKRITQPKQAEVPKQTEAPKQLEEAAKPDKAELPKKAVVVDPFVEAAPKGEGVLMVSSKPPCEIVVDGVPTGLTTPQRALKLSAGTHKITLINGTEKLKKTVTISINPDQPTKVIENFMK